MNRINYCKRISLGHYTREVYDYLGCYQGYDIMIDRDDPEFINIEVLDKNKVNRYNQKKRVAEICLSESINFNGFWQVDSVRIDSKYQGMGLAPKLYAYLIRKLNIRLQAGSCQSPGGRAVWCNLSRRRDVIVYGKTRYGKPVMMVESEERELVPILGNNDAYDGKKEFFMFAMGV